MKLRVLQAARPLAFISIAALLLLTVALLPFAYAEQAADLPSLPGVPPNGSSSAAFALSPTAVYTTYLPLVRGSAAGAATATPTPTATAGAGMPTPTATPTQTTAPGTPPVQEGLFLTRTNRTDSASIAVDAAGGFHFAYAAYVHDASGHRPAYYAYCGPAADCGIESNWATVSLSDDVEDVQLALTKAGHPRLLLRGTEPTAPFDTLFQYAACDANCTGLANWTGIDLTTAQYSLVYLEDYPRRYFALDNQDRPRFLYRKNINDGYYAYCDVDCSTGGAWTQYLLDPIIFSADKRYNLHWKSSRQQALPNVRRVRLSLRKPGKLDSRSAVGGREWTHFVRIALQREQSAAYDLQPGHDLRNSRVSVVLVVQRKLQRYRELGRLRHGYGRGDGRGS
jgi:hypothetical protein